MLPPNLMTALRHLLLLLLLTGGRLSRAATLEEANTHFAAGDFVKAATACEDIIAADGPNAARLYTLGNVRFRLGEYGPAILAYERAALLSPRDPDIRTNLKLARQKATAYDEAPSRAWWESVLHGCSLHEWSWLTTGAAILTALAIMAGGLLGFSRPGLKRSVIAGIVLGIVAGALGGTALWQRRGERDLGIITVKDAALRLSPFATAEPIGSPGPGRTVQLGEHTRGWFYVTIPGANLRGWLPDHDVAPIIPPES